MPANPQVTDEMVEKAIPAIYQTVENYPKYALQQMNGLLAKEIAIRALTAALADHVVGWRTMDSAPKDGTHVLVSDGGIVSEAWFDAEAHGGGWYLANRHWTDGPGPDQIFPTHWQPMPSPFAEKK